MTPSQQSQLAEELFDEIRSRFPKIVIGDEKRNTTLTPEKGRFFNFDYEVDGTNYGSVEISLVDNKAVKVFFDSEIDKEMPDDVRRGWFDFVKHLRMVAMPYISDFDVRDLTKDGLSKRDRTHVARDADNFDQSELDTVTEGRLNGTSRTSYDNLGDVKIIVRHKNRIPMEETPRHARSQRKNIDAIYVQNSLGERFRLPEGTTVNSARAYANHVKHGGAIHDEFGQHIGAIIKEMGDLQLFVRNMRGRQFDDPETNGMVQAAIDHYGSLHRDLHSIKGRKGYAQYKEMWQPEVLQDEFDIDALKERFVKRVFDDRLMNALPVVQRAYNKRKNDVGAEFESWANNLVDEGSEESEEDVVFYIEGDDHERAEAASQAVLDKFGQVIEWQGDKLSAPRKFWTSIEQTAFDAGGEANEYFGDDDMRINEFDQGVAEGADERKQNALWAQITAHEKAAKKSKDSKQQHHLKMADQLRSQLKTSDNRQGVAEDEAGTKGFRVTWSEAGSDKHTSGLLLKPHAIEHAKMLKKKPGTSNVKIVPYRQVSEMDGDGSGRDGSNRKSHSTYGSRDKHDIPDGPDIHLGAEHTMKRKDITKRASDVLNKEFDKSHKKGVTEDKFALLAQKLAEAKAKLAK